MWTSPHFIPGVVYIIYLIRIYPKGGLGPREMAGLFPLSLNRDKEKSRRRSPTAFHSLKLRTFYTFIGFASSSPSLTLASPATPGFSFFSSSFQIAIASAVLPAI